MANIAHYIAHDPIANVEGIVTDFEPSVLEEAAQHGIVFIAVDKDGNRASVDVSEISKPELDDGDCYVFVEPRYVDDRTTAIVACFDALAEIVNPSVATASVDDTETQVDPIGAFMAALEKLRVLKAGGEE